MTIAEHARHVAPPIAPSPPETLSQEFRIVLQGRLDLRFLVILIPNPLPVRNQPPRDKIIVICVELISTKPFLVRKALNKCRIFQDTGPVCNGPPRETGNPSVHVHARGAVEIAPFQVQRSQKAPQTLTEGRALRASQPLIRPDSPVSVLFQRSQHPRK